MTYHPYQPYRQSHPRHKCVLRNKHMRVRLYAQRVRVRKE